MPKIECGWVTCVYNSSEEVGGVGECSAEKVVYRPLEIDCPELDDGEDFYEALECKTYKRGTKEFRRG